MSAGNADTPVCYIENFTEKQELPEILKEIWTEYRKRIKPILRILKDEYKKDIEQGVLLDGLTKLIKCNTQNMTT